MANNDKQQNNKVTSQGTNNKKISAKKSKKSPPSKVKRFFKYFFLTILITGLIVGVVGVGYVVAVIKTSPELDVNAILNLNQTSMLYDNKGEFIDNLPTEEERYVITYDKMPQNLINAYISIEDERFRTHNGIDYRRIAGSIIGNIKYLLTGEGMPQGGSTLTQQLLKNTILYSEASSEGSYIDSINRKIKEINLALQLETKLSKDQIIEAYLNTIPLGGYVYGVEAASLYFFGKPAKDMSLIECAYIAGITQAPSYYSAYNTEAKGYPNTYLDRTKTVLLKMEELGHITKEEYDAAYAEVNDNKFAFAPQIIDYKVNYEWYVYPALAQVKADLMEKYKYTDDEVSKLFMNGGLKIYTAMDRKMQDSVQATLNNRENINAQIDIDYLIGELGLSVNDKNQVVDSSGNIIFDNYDERYEPTRNGVPVIQAAATVMDYRTGQVVALVGGRGEQPAYSTNRAYDELKSIASTTKALTVYSAAIDSKVITAGTPIDDTPISDSIMQKYGYSSSPNNWDKSMNGFITARDAIAFSKNLTSIKTVDKIGLDTGMEYGKKAGLTYGEASKTMSAVALGEYENDPADPDGGNTTILASAFGSFGNNGVRTEPVLYTKVVDSTGKVLLEKEPTTVKLYSPQTAYIMYDILKEPLVRFDAGGARFGDIPVSGKTGTTDKADAYWFAGLTPYYSASVWIGTDYRYWMPKTYSSAAANLFGSVMGPVHEGLENKEIEKPSGIVTKTICIDSGKLATDLCSQDERKNRVRNEMFIEGTEPTAVCDVHVKVKVNKENNKLATENTPEDLVAEKVFIKKENANKSADDYKYVVPTEKDDTKAVEKVKLGQIGLTKNMDLYDAIKILTDKKIKYTFKGESFSGTLKPGMYQLISFPEEIKVTDTAELTIKKIETPPSDNGGTPPGGDTNGGTPPTGGDTNGGTPPTGGTNPGDNNGGNHNP